MTFLLLDKSHFITGGYRKDVFDKNVLFEFKEFNKDMQGNDFFRKNLIRYTD